MMRPVIWNFHRLLQHIAVAVEELVDHLFGQLEWWLNQSNWVSQGEYVSPEVD